MAPLDYSVTTSDLQRSDDLNTLYCNSNTLSGQDVGVGILLSDDSTGEICVSSFPVGVQAGSLPYLVNITNLQSGGFVFYRYLLSEIAGQLLPNNRCAGCRKLIIPGKRGVAVIYSPEHARASYGNLTTCGSIWLCAVCAARISELRRVELVAAAGNHTGGLALITFTLRHKKSDPLIQTMGLLDAAFSKLFQGRWCQDFRSEWGYIGAIKTSETTYGKSGWHPHKHALFFFEGVITDDLAAQLQKALTDRYLYLLEKAGGSAMAGLAVDVRVAKSNREIVAEYLAKFDKLPESPYWGIESELTKSYVKNSKGAAGSTFWELLTLAATGEKKYIDLVREYAAAVKGKSSVRYSRGLREKLGINFDATDQELSDQLEKDGVELALLAREIWRQVCVKKLRGQLLEVAGSGDPKLLNDFLNSQGIVLRGVQ